MCCVCCVMMCRVIVTDVDDRFPTFDMTSYSATVPEVHTPILRVAMVMMSSHISELT